MARFLYRLGRGSAAHRKLVVVAWLFAIVALSGIGKAAGGAFHDTFSVPGTGSQTATDMLRGDVPEPGRELGPGRLPREAREADGRHQRGSRRDDDGADPSSRSCRRRTRSVDDGVDLEGRNDRARDGQVRRSPEQTSDVDVRPAPGCDPPRDRSGAHGGLRWRDPAGGDAALARRDRGHRAARRDGDPAARVRVGHRDGPADRHRAVRARRGHRDHHLPLRVHRHALDVDGHRDDDRARRRHRLRAVHRHPAPRPSSHRGLTVEDVGRAGDRHRRPGCRRSPAARSSSRSAGSPSPASRWSRSWASAPRSSSRSW